MVLITDNVETLEAEARELDREAMRIDGGGTCTGASNDKRNQASMLRRRANELKHRRTDGVRFG